jgi:5'(3')-deoxyribonucleotidase
MKVYLILFIIVSNIHAFQIKPIISKKIPKVSHTKIHDISYKSPIRVRRMEPFAFRLIKEMTNIINVYINETYAMASLPLSYNFANQYNKTKLNEEQ